MTLTQQSLFSIKKYTIKTYFYHFAAQNKRRFKFKVNKDTKLDVMNCDIANVSKLLIKQAIAIVHIEYSTGFQSFIHQKL